jgi:hypothetical protein
MIRSLGRARDNNVIAMEFHGPTMVPPRSYLGPVLALAAWLALAGCVGPSVQPPAMPTIAEVEGDITRLEAIKDPAAFFTAGATRIMANCAGYWDQQQLVAAGNAYASSQAIATGQTLSAILGLAKVAPGPIAAIGVAGPFAADAIANAQANAPGGDHPAEMSTLTGAAQQTLIGAVRTPQTAAEAWAALNGLYRTCTPSGIETLKQQALAAAPNHLEVTPAPAAAPTPAATRSRRRPPVHSRGPLTLEETSTFTFDQGPNGELVTRRVVPPIVRVR